MQLSVLTDQELVRSYLNGNENAFEELLRRHKQRIFSQIFMLVRDEDLANDIFQDTFIKVILTLKSGKYKEEGKFLPWVMRIAHNLTIDAFRKSKKMQMLRSDDEFDIFNTLAMDELNVEQTIVREQIHKDVRNLIQYLPDEQKEVVLMRIYEGLSFKEIAEKTEVSINTALGRMRYALINIRKLVDQDQISLME